MPFIPGLRMQRPARHGELTGRPFLKIRGEKKEKETNNSQVLIKSVGRTWDGVQLVKYLPNYTT